MQTLMKNSQPKTRWSSVRKMFNTMKAQIVITGMLKPQIQVRPSMQNLLSGKTKDLMEGKGRVGNEGLSWICGFSIPGITICAFIVLNIFLTLLNLVFGWLFFIKVCVPFPKIGNKPPGSS